MRAWSVAGRSAEKYGRACPTNAGYSVAVGCGSSLRRNSGEIVASRRAARIERSLDRGSRTRWRSCCRDQQRKRVSTCPEVKNRELGLVAIMSGQPKLRLGVNIDHVATIRNARGGRHPDPVKAALLAVEAGADGITAHLREDRRHIRDDDITRLKAQLTKPLNFEMAAAREMVDIALKARPHAACIVPERRQEVTTEGGLDVVRQHNQLTPIIAELKAAGIRVSLFIGAA